LFIYVKLDAFNYGFVAGAKSRKAHDYQLKRGLFAPRILIDALIETTQNYSRSFRSTSDSTSSRMADKAIEQLLKDGK